MVNVAPARIRIREQGGTLEVLLAPAESFAAIRPQFDELLAYCREHRPARLLIDFRSLDVPITTLDRYDLGVLGGRLAVDVHRVACVLTEQQRDPQKFGAKVARNRGLTVDVFTDESEARRWLQAQ